MLELEVRTVPVDDEFRLRADALDLDGRLRRRRHRRDDLDDLGRPGAAIADAARPPASGSTSTRPTPARPRSARSCGAFDGWERADSVVVNPHKWLFDADGLLALWTRRPEELRARVQPRTGVPARREDVVEPSDYGPRSAAASARSSSGRCCAATAARACRR